mgnify:CR=1 FL=1
MKKWNFWLIALLLGSVCALGQNSFRLGVLKYRGGGDYYVNPSAVSNLARYANEHLPSTIEPEYDYVEPGSPALFDYPWIHMTGHGNVIWNEQEEQNLRLYLEAGGFLHIDDNYGMDSYIRREIKQLFPEKQLRAVGPGHPLYRFMNCRMGSLKSTNTTIKLPKPGPSIMEDASCCSILMNLIWEMDGKIPQFTTIPRKSASWL